MCQCSLFKQFTTSGMRNWERDRLFIVCVNVLFLSNSQQESYCHIHWPVVYRMCQCSLFKQFTTVSLLNCGGHLLFIVCVNVLFLSNSQRWAVPWFRGCVVYRMCQCSLFKQFTTLLLKMFWVRRLFIVCVNVLFLSNSQLAGTFCFATVSCLSYVSMFSF